MVDVCSKKCRTEGCGKQPSFGVADTKTAEYCAKHAPGEMVNICHKKFRSEGCDKRSSFGVAGTKTVKYCARRTPEGIVDVIDEYIGFVFIFTAQPWHSYFGNYNNSLR